MIWHEVFIIYCENKISVLYIRPAMFVNAITCIGSAWIYISIYIYIYFFFYSFLTQSVTFYTNLPDIQLSPMINQAELTYKTIIQKKKNCSVVTWNAVINFGGNIWFSQLLLCLIMGIQMLASIIPRSRHLLCVLAQRVPLHLHSLFIYWEIYHQI